MERVLDSHWFQAVMIVTKSVVIEVSINTIIQSRTRYYSTRNPGNVRLEIAFTDSYIFARHFVKFFAWRVNHLMILIFASFTGMNYVCCKSATAYFDFAVEMIVWQELCLFPPKPQLLHHMQAGTGSLYRGGSEGYTTCVLEVSIEWVTPLLRTLEVLSSSIDPEIEIVCGFPQPFQENDRTDYDSFPPHSLHINDSTIRRYITLGTDSALK
jgi:hypothetical protein